MEHSSYQLPPKGQDGLPKAKRWFVAPVTCHAESYNPSLNSTIHFIPTQPGECTTIVIFPSFKAPSFIPQALMDLAKLFYMQNGLYKFLSQDRIIMQSQDDRKIHSSSKGWDDLYPAIADKGVRAFQTWSRTYAGRPEFTMPSPFDKEGRQYSFWESSAKYDMSCVRSIRRLGWLAKKSKMLSTLTFLGSIGAALKALLAKQNEVMLVKSALALLLSSVTSWYLANWSLNTIDSVFTNPGSIAKYKMMQIYQK